MAAPLSYRVFATLGRKSQPTALRLCTRPPASFVQVKAPGTFKYRGVYCRDYGHVLPGRSVSFLVHAFPSAAGRLTPVARATAVGAPRESRVSAAIDVSARWRARRRNDPPGTRPAERGTLNAERAPAPATTNVTVSADG